MKHMPAVFAEETPEVCGGGPPASTIMAGDGDSDAVYFPWFSKLPPEIRQYIWQLLLPARGRVFAMEEHLGLPPYTDLNLEGRAVRVCPDHISSTPLSVPVSAAVCRESRAVAMIGGAGSRLIRSPGHPRHPEGRRTWFNPRRDELCLHSWLYELPPFGESITKSCCFDLREICRDVENICLNIRSLTWDLFPLPSIVAFNLMDRRLWPRLRRYRFFGDVFYVHLPPEVLQTQPFFEEGEHTILVNALDHVKLGRMYDLFREYNEQCTCICPATGVGDDDHANRCKIQQGHVRLLGFGTPGEADDYVQDHYEALRNIWLHAHYSALPDRSPVLKDRHLFLPLPQTPAQPRFNHGHPWARKMLQGMPEYELVIMFKLCTAKEHHEPIKLYQS